MPLLRQQGVADAMASQFVIMLDAVLLDPFPQVAGQLGTLYILAGDEVVGCDHDAIRIEDPVQAVVGQHLDSRRSSYFVAHDQVHPGLDQVTGQRLTGHGVCRQQLFSMCQSHE